MKTYKSVQGGGSLKIDEFEHIYFLNRVLRLYELFFTAFTEHHAGNSELSLGHIWPMGHHFTSLTIGNTTVLGLLILWPPQDWPLIDNTNLQDYIAEHHFEDASIFLP